jgi:archaeal cell division control protein 6
MVFVSILKKNIFSDSRKISSIFKDESVFDIGYFPDEVKSRDVQIKDIKYSLEPIIYNKKTQSLLIYGPPGTGKTLVTIFVLNHLVNYTSKVKYIYVNGISENTRHAVLHKIGLIFNVLLPRRGLAVDEIIVRIKEGLSKSLFTPIIVIDEIDHINKEDSSLLLYDLSRISENTKYFCLILITNNKNFLIDLDNKTQSSLFLTTIPFSRYSPKELKEILKERADYGLLKDSLSEDLLGYVAGFAAKRGGDARIGIDLLYKSAKLSEQKGLLKITKENLLAATKIIDSIKFSEKREILSEDQISLLKAIEDGMLTSMLYSKKILPERTVRRYLSIFEKLNLLRLEEINSGKGRTRKIFLNFDKDLI